MIFFLALFAPYFFIFLSLPPFKTQTVIFLPASSQCILIYIRCPFFLPLVIKKMLIISAIVTFLTECSLRKESKNFIVKCAFYRNTQPGLHLKCLCFKNNSAAWLMNWEIARVLRNMSSSKFHDLNNKIFLAKKKKKLYLKIPSRIYCKEQGKSFEKVFININYSKNRHFSCIVHCF